MGITGDSRLVKLVEQAIQARHPPGHRPLDVLIGGTHVDLLLLLCKVRNFGGYSKTSGARKWGTVATSLGLPPHCGPSVKLVYLKYLKNLESGGVFAAADAKSRDKNAEPDAKSSPSSTLSEALGYVKRLALDPGDASDSAGHQGTLKNILKCLRKEEERPNLHERQARRTASALRYSLRSFRPRQLENGLLSSPSVKKVSVPIGPDFQAEVPAAVSGVDEESMVFVGRVVWSPKEAGVRNIRSAYLEERSRECIKLRIKEQSRKLEVELGKKVFEEWGFDKMGENLIESARWKKEEEAEFAAIVQECHRGDKEERLWPELQVRFAGRRSRADLVSYFFNVYMLRRRALQNRIYEPGVGKFDSDKEDDSQEVETETFGFDVGSKNLDQENQC